MSDWTHLRAKLAVATRDGASEEKLEDLRRDLKAARVVEDIKQIRKVVQALPPLTDAQRAELTSILSF